MLVQLDPPALVIMPLLNSLDSYIDNWRKLDYNIIALIVISFSTGLIFILYNFIRSIHKVILGLRLYVFSQYCCRGNLLRKYGTWAVVTGATDGIGKAIAFELARRGHSIIVVGRNKEKLKRTKVSLESETNVGEVLTVEIDLFDSSEENYERIRTQIDPDNRDIGILVNNAGVFTDTFQHFHNMDMSFVKNMINVNILAVLYFTRMILPGMKERQKGLILNVSSQAAYCDFPYSGAYGPSKTFINSFSRALQFEYSCYPIDIINLTTGLVHTSAFKRANKPPEPTFISPTPEKFAQSTLNAVSSGISSFSGYWSHGLCKRPIILLKSLGLIQPFLNLILKKVAKNYKVSSFCQRKRQIEQSSTFIEMS